MAEPLSIEAFVNVTQREAFQRFGPEGREAVLRQLAALLSPSALQTALAALRDQCAEKTTDEYVYGQIAFGGSEVDEAKAQAPAYAFVVASIDTLLAAHPETPQRWQQPQDGPENERVLVIFQRGSFGFGCRVRAENDHLIWTDDDTGELIGPVGWMSLSSLATLAASREPQPTEPTHEPSESISRRSRAAEGNVDAAEEEAQAEHSATETQQAVAASREQPQPHILNDDVSVDGDPTKFLRAGSTVKYLQHLKTCATVGNCRKCGEDHRYGANHLADLAEDNETCDCGLDAALAASREQPSEPPQDAFPFLDIVFDGPPSHESGRFVEVEGPDGRSINAGEWIDRGDGLWALRIGRTLRAESAASRVPAPTKEQ